ncbi:MAG: Smr/MutS family protein [Pseudomonadota bacterium]|nr:Smr/MutS family protein [Pseudomonadota bacterium]
MSYNQEPHVKPLPGALYLSYTGLGIQHNQFKRLKQGLIAWQHTIDLHGYRVREAQAYLEDKLRSIHHSGERAVLIIHGKGHPSNGSMIKGFVQAYLKASPRVLAFCSAQPKDGGTGAVYCLLKN